MRSGRAKPVMVVVTYLVLLATGLAGLSGSELALPLVDPPPGAPVAGIDTSNHQHPRGVIIDWLAVRDSGVGFAYIKATEGVSFVDPWFASDWTGVGRAGLYRGAYHYARPEAGRAVAAAAAFVGVVGRLGSLQDLPPALDLETDGGLSPAALADWVADWVGEVERRTGRSPIIYTRESFWTTHMGATSRFSDLGLWVARYTDGADPGPTFGGWPRWALWQWSSTGSTPGVATQVDQDRLAGGGPALAALAARRVTVPR